MSLEALSADVDALSNDVSTLNGEAKRLRDELQDARAGEARLRDLLGEDDTGKPLKVAPLLVTMLGTTAAMGNVVAVYIVGIMVVGRPRPDSDTPAALFAWLGCSIVSLVALHYGKRKGAGGSARALLRPLGQIRAVGTTPVGALLGAIGYLAPPPNK